jgi:hypothetical protein
VSCSNGTHASRQFLSFPRRWRQPQPRNRRKGAENREERRRRARPLPRPQLVLLPRLTRRLHRTWRPHLALRLRLTPRPLHVRHRTSPRQKLPRTSPRRMCRRSARRHNRSALLRGKLPDTRRRRELRRQRSNSRKPPAAAAAVERNSPSRLSPARATMWGAHPRRRAPRRRWALPRRAPRQQHRPLTADATRPSNKM